MTQLISVVIPFYSNKSWLLEALDSVLTQTYKNIEIIVVNDGSKENINDISYINSNIHVYHQNNKGAGAARNTGIAFSKGDYISFLDSDDLWEPTKLEEQLEYMINNSLFCSHSDYLRFWENKKYKYISAKFTGDVFLKSLIWIPIATPCVMVKRDFLIQNNLLFREGKDIGEDSYLWQNISKLTRWGYIPKPLAKVRMRGSNSAFNYMLQLKFRASLLSIIRDNKKEFKSVFTYKLVEYLSLYCLISYISLNKLFHNKSNRLCHIIAQILYIYPYLHYRIIRFFI